MKKVDKTNECWLWTAYKDKDGYGKFGINNKTFMAHRFSYEYFIGKIPDGFQIDHLCRVRNCVNPDHLEPVTPKENTNRGNIAEYQKIKTHCPSGHEYSGKNNRGERICHKCINEKSKTYYYNKKLTNKV